MRVWIRWMIRRDLAEALEIEAADPHPWGEDRILRHLRRRPVIGMVAEHGERVLGYMIYRMHPRRLEILKFAVHPDYRRQGIGTRMAAKIVGKLSSHRRTMLTTMVRESNLDGQLFWKAMGFEATGVEREYFGDEDAYAFEYHLPVEAWSSEAPR